MVGNFGCTYLVDEFSGVVERRQRTDNAHNACDNFGTKPSVKEWLAKV